MKFANLVAHDATKNNYFSLTSRDNCNYAFWLLREKLRNIGVNLNTPDVNLNKKIAFEIHLNVNPVSNENTFLLLWETPEIYPPNGNEKLYRKYKKVFSWDDFLVSKNNFYKFYLPTPGYEVIKETPGWEDRQKFCCMIAGNKVSRKKSKNELYSQRIKTIRWFEKNSLEDFDLYGIGWDGIPRSLWKGGGLLQVILGNLLSSCIKRINYSPKQSYFPSYKGIALNKINTLKSYKFSICYENVANSPGYITEKLFDCFVAGTVPIYWGANNIDLYVPEETYIKRSNFRNEKEMNNFLKSITKNSYATYQNKISNFLKSSSAKLFTPEFFVQNLVKNIY